MKTRDILVLLLSIFFLGCTTTQSFVDKSNLEESDPQAQTNLSTEGTSLTTEEISEANRLEEINTINAFLDQLTVDQMIGQLLILSIINNDKGEFITEADDFTLDLIENIQPGGIILFKDNIEDALQLRALTKDLQNQSSIPLFLTVDEEGGMVSRIGANPKVGATFFPAMASIGQREDPFLAERTGLIMGTELNALGFNMDMAPVGDINTNPDNMVIGNRSFGSDPELVGSMISSFITGLHQSGLASVIKHFPGHGDTSTDSHSGTVIINHSLERLFAVEFVPFIRGIEAGTDCIMVGHISCPSITGDNTPATLSYEIETEILREQLGFKGLIVTDAMEMGAISKYYSVEDSTVKAFLAGADIILVPGDPERAFNALREAYITNVITKERLTESLFRILRLKYQLGLLDNSRIQPSLDLVGSEEHLLFRNTLM